MQQKIPISLLVALVTCITVATPSHAQEAEGKNELSPGLYFSLDTGVAIVDAEVNFTGLTAMAGGTPNGTLDTGYILGGALGWQTPGAFRFEAELRLRDADTDSDVLQGRNEGNQLGANGMPLQDLSANTFAYDGSLSTTSLMANAFYDFKDTGLPFIPYAKAGAGIARNSVETELDATLAVADQFGAAFNNVVFREDSTEDFSWNLGVGAAFQISEGTVLDLELLHSDLGEGVTEFDALGDAIAFKDLRSTDVTAGVRIKF